MSAVNTGGPYKDHFALESAQWILGAPDCSPGNQIEIQTFGYTVEGGKLISVPASEVAFSFSVDGK
ncbi:MAG: hypothetical protein ACRDK7_03595 [Solirubrobacteraceae bacterium]